MAGAIAGSGGAVDLSGTVFVEAHGEFGAGARLKFREGGERNHLALSILDEKLADIFSASTIGALRLDVHLPLAAETIEIVYEKTAHESLQSLVDVPDGDALLDDFVAVHVDKLLWDAGEKSCTYVGDFRAFAGSSEKFI